MLQYANVPYVKIFQVRFSKNDLHTAECKPTHGDTDFPQVFIGKKQSRRSTSHIHPVQEMDNNPEPEAKILMSRRQKSDKQERHTKKYDIKK